MARRSRRNHFFFVYGPGFGKTAATSKRQSQMLARTLLQSPLALSLLYVAAYVVLDWVSFIYPFGPFGVTPWNPGTGLHFVIVLIGGRRYVPLLFLCSFLSDVLQRLESVSTLLSAAISITTGAVYSAGALFLYSRSTWTTVISTRALGQLFAVAVVCSFVVAMASVGIYALGGLIAWSDYLAASLRFWVGDLIGIAIVTPFMLILLTRERFGRPSLENIASVLVVLAVVAFVFSAPPDRQFQLFYLLFLPVVWIAVRSGFEAITVVLVVIQVALIGLLQVRTASAVDVTSIQACLLVLAFTGLTAGMLVTERQRAVNQQRLQQDVQARLQQLGTMGELTSMLAHELNQPLMAAGTYTRVAAEAIEALPGAEKPLTAARKAVQQVERAAEVVRRLRGLVRLGRSEREYIQVRDVVTTSLDLLAPDLEARPLISIANEVEPDLPEVLADRVQVEQVLLNLLRNALEVLAETQGETGHIVLRAAIEPNSDAVRLEVWDDGPGFAPNAHAEIAPFRSTKPGGLGIGLALSRTLVEAHGGRLEILPCAKGACVAFTLPIG